jgi:hypothetical protein
MNDYIGSAHMTQESSSTFTLDRFGNNNSALALNGSWTQVPAGIYFNHARIYYFSLGLSF